MKRIIITVEETKPGLLAVDIGPGDETGTPMEDKLAQRINNRIAAKLELFIADIEFDIKASVDTELPDGAAIIKSAKEGFRR